MRVFIRCFRAEFVKSRHSAILYIHIVLPVLCAVVFAGYYHISGWGVSAKISAYLEALAISIPFLIGIILGQALQIEHMAGDYQLMLGTIPSRNASFLGKLVFLMCFFFGAVILALGTFALLYPAAPLCLYGKALFLLLLTAFPLYVIHLYVGMRFGNGATLGLGIAGSLLSALMITGLGDTVWKAVPWAWSVRAMDFVVLSLDNPRFYLSLQAEFAIGMTVCACSSVCLLAACLLWFRRWDGGKTTD